MKSMFCTTMVNKRQKWNMICSHCILHLLIITQLVATGKTLLNSRYVTHPLMCEFCSNRSHKSWDLTIPLFVAVSAKERIFVVTISGWPSTLLHSSPSVPLLSR
jgi:hypothetical protein